MECGLGMVCSRYDENDDENDYMTCYFIYSGVCVQQSIPKSKQNSQRLVLVHLHGLLFCWCLAAPMNELSCYVH